MLLLTFFTTLASAQSVCIAELGDKETQGSIKAKLKCLADEREKLTAELSDRTAKLQELTQLRANAEYGYKAQIAELTAKLDASRSPTYTYHFARISGDKKECKQRAMNWIQTVMNGTVTRSGETWINARIGEQFVILRCGMTLVGTTEPLDVGYLFVQGGTADDVGKLKDEFKSSSQTPF